jgi:hypothetical protein
MEGKVRVEDVFLVSRQQRHDDLHAAAVLAEAVA